MGTKTIGLREDVYERLRARKREGESFTDLVDRLIDESETDWESTFGTLPSADAAELETIVRRSRERSGHSAADRQRDALRAFDEVTDTETNDEDEATNGS